MNKENVIKLATALRDVEARDSKLFDMNDWGDDMWCELLGNMDIKAEECGDAIDEDEDEDEDPGEDYGRVEIAGIELDDKIDHCSTSGCIAGWAVLVLGDGPPGQTAVPEYAQVLLGLEDNVASQLFTPGMDQIHREMQYSDITAGMSADVLTHLAATGNVDWRIVDWVNPFAEEEDEE